MNPRHIAAVSVAGTEVAPVALRLILPPTRDGVDPHNSTLGEIGCGASPNIGMDRSLVPCLLAEEPPVGIGRAARLALVLFERLLSAS